MGITVDQMMRIEEQGHAMGFEKRFMMENAGAAAVRRLLEAFGDVSSKNILVIAGTGNNGGDGMVMARHLAGFGAHVRLALLGDAASLRTEETRWNWSLLSKVPSVIHVADYTTVTDAEVIVDAILGTGVTGAPREPHASAISFVNAATAFKVAVDVPSGLDATTGKAAAECVKADMTVTFHRIKSGMESRTDVCGKTFVEKIGIPPEAESGIL